MFEHRCQDPRKNRKERGRLLGRGTVRVKAERWDKGKKVQEMQICHLAGGGGEAGLERQVEPDVKDLESYAVGL